MNLFMKCFTVAIVSLITSSAFATDYLCKIDNSDAGSDQTLLLKKLGDLPNRSDSIDRKESYNVQIQTSELPFPDVNVNGVAETADVAFSFKSDDGKITVSMSLDDISLPEMTGTLKQNGKVRLFSECTTF